MGTHFKYIFHGIPIRSTNRGMDKTNLRGHKSGISLSGLSLPRHKRHRKATLRSGCEATPKVCEDKPRTVPPVNQVDEDVVWLEVPVTDVVGREVEEGLQELCEQKEGGTDRQLGVLEQVVVK